MNIVPRQYQLISVSKAVPALRISKKALIVLATGLGKTITAALTARKFKARKTLFLVHNNFILDNAITEFKKVFGENLNFATYNGFSKENAHSAAFVFASFQSMGPNLEVWSRRHFDLVIVDESHHIHAKTYLPVIKHFTAPRLGITATPDRSDLKDIRKVFGSEVVNITLEEAIARGWLPRIEYHAITDESLDENALQKIMSEIRESKKRFTMAEVNRRIFIRKRDEEIARIINGYNEKAVVFCPSITDANRFSRHLHLAATFHSSTSSYQEKTWKRNLKTLENLHNGIIRRVCAVNAFNEGVNVPSVRLVVFRRVTESVTIFRQQLGRGLRPGKDKLIVLDFVGNLERIQLVLEMMKRISDLYEPTGSEGDVRERFEVSGKGFEFTFSEKIEDVVKILEHCKRNFYPTWQEASEAAQGLGIKVLIQYLQLYKKDPKLHSTPYTFYKNFPGWKIFLGKERKTFYQTWREAAKVALALNIKSFKDYKRMFKKSKHLPSNPKEFYQDFPGWDKFLGYDPYPTWQEASKAAKRLDIKNRKEYLKKYTRDRRLRGCPEKTYSDFPGWIIFFGGKVKEIYSTWQEASRATQRLGIKTAVQYQQKYSRDPRLPSNLDKTYKNFPGRFKFFGKPQKAFYLTWQEASKAAIRMGMQEMSTYRKSYKKDPKLPCQPRNKYKNYPGDAKFFGR